MRPKAPVRRSSGAARNRHASAPSAARRQYTQPSALPTRTTPSWTVGGESIRPPAVNVQHGRPSLTSNAWRASASRAATSNRPAAATGGVSRPPTAACHSGLTAAGTAAVVEPNRDGSWRYIGQSDGSEITGFRFETAS